MYKRFAEVVFFVLWRQSSKVIARQYRRPRGRVVGNARNESNYTNAKQKQPSLVMEDRSCYRINALSVYPVFDKRSGPVFELLKVSLSALLFVITSCFLVFDGCYRSRSVVVVCNIYFIMVLAVVAD